MKRRTIFVSESLERDLQLYARREQKAVASVVREALAEYLAARRPTAALPSFTGIGRSGRRDIASRHEELLWRDPHEDVPAPSRRGGQRRPSARKPRGCRSLSTPECFTRSSIGATPGTAGPLITS